MPEDDDQIPMGPEPVIHVEKPLLEDDLPPAKGKSPEINGVPEERRRCQKKLMRVNKKGGHLYSGPQKQTSAGFRSKLEVIEKNYPPELLAEAWERRVDMLTDDYGNDQKAIGTVLKILEEIAEGARWAKVLHDHNLSWHGYYATYIRRFQRANLCHIAAIRMGAIARKDLIEEEAYRRAVEGYDEEVYTATGKFAGMRRKYSDGLMALMLRASNPSKYGAPGITAQGGAAGGVVLQVNLGLRPPAEKTVEAIEPTPEEEPEEATDE